jgi:hypothetical protein
MELVIVILALSGSMLHSPLLQGKLSEMCSPGPGETHKLRKQQEQHFSSDKPRFRPGLIEVSKFPHEVNRNFGR